MEAISSIPQMEPSKFEGILNSAMQVATPSCVVEQLRLLHSLPPTLTPLPLSQDLLMVVYLSNLVKTQLVLGEKLSQLTS